MNTVKRAKIKKKIISIFSILVFLGIWYLATAVLKLAPSYSLPDPIKVFTTFIKKLYTASPDGSTLLVHFWSSVKVAMLGYIFGVVIGIPTGIAMGWYKWVDKIIRPVFDFIKPIPPIALIPVMIVIFGISIESKATIIFFSTVIPCIVNSYSGIKQTNQIHLWVSQTFGATNKEQLFTVAIPSALPMIFAGLRVAMGSSWMGLVAAELLGSSSGIGYMISVGRSLLRSDIIIVGILTLGIIGIIISLSFDLLEKLLVHGGSER
jgi:ABC-type nitrate/sulfonate/bicarbonate transport system permease component